jgi:7-carboxy-7-deazaguanine synthase
VALRLLEHYPSVQGEGPRTGVATQFVRFAGCNLKCPAWPCDTPHAIDPKLFRKEQQLVTVEDLAKGIDGMYKHTAASNICLTGGEPFLQNKDEVAGLCAKLFDEYEFDVEVFTNGTIAWPRELLDYVSFVCDWKLNGSGENPYDEVRIKNINEMYSCNAPELHAVKFTVKDESDLMQAVSIVKTYNLYDSIQGVEQPRIYVGVVWGQQYTTAKLVEDMLKLRLDWRLNIQVHQYIWDPQERGR